MAATTIDSATVTSRMPASTTGTPQLRRSRSPRATRSCRLSNCSGRRKCTPCSRSKADSPTGAQGRARERDLSCELGEAAFDREQGVHFRCPEQLLGRQDRVRSPRARVRRPRRPGGARRHPRCRASALSIVVACHDAPRPGRVASGRTRPASSGRPTGGVTAVGTGAVAVPHVAFLRVRRRRRWRSRSW